MRTEALELLIHHPERVGQACGFARLNAALHGLWMRQMLSAPGDITILAHRGSYKTTCLSLVIAILLCTEPEKNILFLRKTDDDVAEMLRQVRGLLEGDVFQQLTCEIYGQPVRVLRANNTELLTDVWQSPRGAVQLLGQGIGGSLTGKHADLIFTDDIVNLQDRLSRAERERTRAIYQELQNIRNPGGRIISTGTPWHPMDATSLMPNVRRWDCYTSGLLDAARIEALRAAMVPSLFAANYELRHIPSEDVLFSETPPFTADETVLRDGIAHLDASYGGGDFTALTCGDRRGDTYYLYGRLWHRRVDALEEEIISECARLAVAPLYCESNADKGFLARSLREKGMPVRTYAEKQAKFMKIATFLRRAWPRVVFVRGTDPDYVHQILSYSELAEHDDAPDSAASLVRVLERRG